MPKGIYNHKFCSEETKRKIRETEKGKKLSKETRKKIRKAQLGMKNNLWRGNEVGYNALHTWVNRYKGKPKTCEHCGKTTGRIEWANIDHKYRRNLDDFIALCVKCHKKYDKR